jgi:hypothetical protein
MKKFILRNDDVAYDTTLSEIKQFCEICDKYNITILHAIMPIGEARKIKSAKTSNEQLRATSSKLFSENKEVLKYLLSRNDLIGVHGLWHTHEPSIEEINIAKIILKGLGFHPTYFIPPFNQGDYPDEVVGLTTSKLSEKHDRLEAFLDEGVPSSEMMYLHSWRFDNNWFTFDTLELCLKRIFNA